MLLIAQITDVHVGFHRAEMGDPNLERFRQILERLVEGPDVPDVLLLTGDLTEHGDPESYAALTGAIEEANLPFPVWAIPGNHDKRAPFADAFPQVPQGGALANYALEFDGLRVLMVDSLHEGRHGGGFCEERQAWLSAQLSAHPDTPTLVVIHHPPLPLGIAWMDPEHEEPWIDRFAAAIAGHNQIRAIISGHLHRPISSSFNGVPVSVCPSSAAGLALDLRPIDPKKPDGRALIIDDLAGFALHRWDGRILASHYADAPDPPTLARYDEKLQPMIVQLSSEAP